MPDVRATGIGAEREVRQVNLAGVAVLPPASQSQDLALEHAPAAVDVITGEACAASMHRCLVAWVVARWRRDPPLSEPDAEVCPRRGPLCSLKLASVSWEKYEKVSEKFGEPFSSNLSLLGVGMMRKPSAFQVPTQRLWGAPR